MVDVNIDLSAFRNATLIVLQKLISELAATKGDSAGEWLDQFSGSCLDAAAQINLLPPDDPANPAIREHTLHYIGELTKMARHKPSSS